MYAVLCFTLFPKFTVIARTVYHPPLETARYIAYRVRATYTVSCNPKYPKAWRICPI